jgi:hypothetical protein
MIFFRAQIIANSIFWLISGLAFSSEVAKNNRVLISVGIEDILEPNVVTEDFGLTYTLRDVKSLIVNLPELVNKLPAVIRQAARCK